MVCRLVMCVCVHAARMHTRTHTQPTTDRLTPTPTTLTQQTNRPCLEELVASDPDGDVKYYAALALEGKEAPAPGPAPVDAAGVGSAVGAVAVSAQG